MAEEGKQQRFRCPVAYMIPGMGMMVSLVWAFVILRVVSQRTRVRLRELEVKELELKAKG